MKHCKKEAGDGKEQGMSEFAKGTDYEIRWARIPQREWRPQYDDEQLERYRRLAQFGFKAAEIDPKRAAVRVLQPGTIGPNGLVRLHLRAGAGFFGRDSDRLRVILIGMLAAADDLFFGQTTDKSEVLITFGVTGIVTNWREDAAGTERWVSSPEEIGL